MLIGCVFGLACFAIGIMAGYALSYSDSVEQKKIANSERSKAEALRAYCDKVDVKMLDALYERDKYKVRFENLKRQIDNLYQMTASGSQLLDVSQDESKA